MKLNNVPISAPQFHRRGLVPLGRYSTFGERLRVAMYCAQTTQSRLARKLGVAQSSINGWINNRSMPGSNFIKPMTKALNVSADWLLDIDQPEPGKDPVDYSIGHFLKQTAADLDKAITRLERITGKAPSLKADRCLGDLVSNDKSTVWSDNDA